MGEARQYHQFTRGVAIGVLTTFDGRRVRGEDRPIVTTLGRTPRGVRRRHDVSHQINLTVP